MAKLYSGKSRDGREIALFHDASSRLPYVVTERHGDGPRLPVISCDWLGDAYREYNRCFLEVAHA